jgi:poly(glycerol-phosphate) alpha-glucosyltransferase
LDNISVNQEILNKIKIIESFKFVFIGRIVEEKKIDHVIRIMYHLKNAGINVHLFIFGNGLLRNKIIRLINDLQIKEIVSFLGVVPSPKVYLKYFNCLILTSEREGMPFAIWESMSQGLPILSSSVGGITEVLNEARCGLLFNKDNIFEAVEKAQLLIKNEKMRERFGLNGEIAISEKYNFQNFKIFIENLYVNLIDKN